MGIAEFITGPAEGRTRWPHPSYAPQILPDGQITDFRVQSSCEKYSALPRPQIKDYLTPSHPTEGRIMIVTDAGRDAVDAVASGAIVIAGRVSARERSNGARDERC
jgi:hypothetical protein